MFNLEERTPWDNIKLTGTFGFLGGYTAILSLLLLGIFVNSMTINATNSGLALARQDLKYFAEVFMVLISFVAGAFLSTKIFDRFNHVPVLLLQATLLLLIGIEKIGLPYEAWLAAMSMGLQNALTTCVSWDSGKVQTTHVTGTSTDIGIAIANLNYRKVFHLSFLLGFYFLGSLIAIFVSRKIGYQAFILGVIIILAALAIDTVFYLIKNKQPSDSQNEEHSHA
ncbi:MAG: DUF1275 domain-containing protein [Candidatus Schekmanbacteria bacterium]|nr:DUF1275 domain-containing protein [Candidatus Schekmanbacteria bacterium]